MSGDQLSDREKALFRSLEQTKTPPKRLEDRVVSALKEEGQIVGETRNITYWRWAAAAVLAGLLFWSGMRYQQWQSPAEVAIAPEKGYIMLLHETAAFQPGEPMEMFEEYGMWMENTFQRGVKITGQELSNDAAVVDSEKRVAFLDERADKKTTGYFILEANSLEEAIEVAKANPHIKYGGSIEVKPFIVR